MFFIILIFRINMRWVPLDVRADFNGIVSKISVPLHPIGTRYFVVVFFQGQACECIFAHKFGVG
jgi:hypothetical protein